MKEPAGQNRSRPASPLGALNAVAAAAYTATARIAVSWPALLGRFGLAAGLMPARSG
jgi:hypothetical protein